MDYDRSKSPLYKLLLSGRQLKFPKGQIVSGFSDNDLLHLIKTGYIKRYLITKEGGKAVQVVFGPQDIVPLTPVYKSLFDTSVYTGLEQYYYEAMTPVELYSIDKATLLEAVDQNPLIYKDLFLAAGLRLNSYIQRLESMSTRMSSRKVAHQLVYFADFFGKTTPEGVQIQLPLTHQNLADVLNLARETVTISMARLQRKGLVLGDKNLVIPDVEALRREVG